MFFLVWRKFVVKMCVHGMKIIVFQKEKPLPVMAMADNCQEIE
jgi:hypothetical protein